MNQEAVLYLVKVSMDPVQRSARPFKCDTPHGERLGSKDPAKPTPSTETTMVKEDNR